MPDPIVPDFITPPKQPLFRRQIRRRLIIAGIILAFFALLLLVAGRPALHAIRGWQARRHARHAFVLIEQRKWSEARSEAVAAYQLMPNEPESLRAVARLLSRVGQSDGLEFWKRLAEVAPLTADDLRDRAQLALKINDLSTARDAVQQLLAYPNHPLAVSDYLVAAEVAVRRHDYKQGAKYDEKALADPKATREEQLRATLSLGSIAQSGGASFISEPKKIGERLAALAAGEDDTSLQALIVLAQRALAGPGQTNEESPIPIADLIQRIESHPRATVATRLVAADLEILQDSSKRNLIEQQAIDRSKNSSNEDLAALGAWFYRRGEYQRELDVISPERAMQTRDLFVERLDALASLQRWDEIQKLLESERYPLDPVIQNMYLALCYAKQGQEISAHDSWQRAIENAAGDPNKLVAVAVFAEKNGVGDVAATAYNAAVAAAPKSVDAQLGRLRAIRATNDTPKIYSVVKELLKLWPNDTNLQNDELYLQLLLLPPETRQGSSELNSLQAAAEKLLQDQPDSFPHRTVLALALLKQNQPYTALSLYRNVAVSRAAVTPSTIAVHAAVLRASGQSEEAKAEAAKIPKDKLLPEERTLIANM